MMTEAQTLVTGLIRFETVSGNISVEIYGKNLMDKEYQTFYYQSYGGLGIKPIRGREFGIQLIYNL